MDSKYRIYRYIEIVTNRRTITETWAGRIFCNRRMQNGFAGFENTIGKRTHNTLQRNGGYQGRP